MKNFKFLRTGLVLTLVVAIMLSVTGGTIAWFTDTVESSANVIQSGNLDVDVTYTTETGEKSIQDAAELFTDVALWEPGAVAWENLTVTNKGDLALKYEMTINSTNANTVETDGVAYGLPDILKVAVVDGPITATDRNALLNSIPEDSWKTFSAFVAEGGLLPQDASHIDVNNIPAGVTGSSKTYGMVIYWQPSAEDNNWNVNNGKTVSDVNAEKTNNYLHVDLGVKLTATQLAAEDDSFGPDYDAGASLSTVKTAAELMSALEMGGNIVLGNDITIEQSPAITKDTVVNLNGKTLTHTGNRAYALSVSGDADLTVYGGKMVAESTNGQVTGTGTSTGSSSNIYFASTGNLLVEDVEIEGSVRGGHRAIDMYKGNGEFNNVTINSSYGSGITIGGSNTKAVLENCNITVNGMYSAPYNSVCFGVWGGGEMTINSGNYKLINDNLYATGNTHGGWVGIVMNSGGTITTLGGTYTNVPAEGFTPQYERAILEAQNNAPAVSTLNMYGGTFIPQKQQVYGGYGDQYYPKFNGILTSNGDGTWTASYEGALVDSAEDLVAALTSGKDIMLTTSIDYTAGISLASGVKFNGNGKTITYIGTDSDYDLVKLNTGAVLENVKLDNYRVRTEEATDGTVTLTDVDIHMDNDLTGLDISRGSGTAVLTNVKCKSITDATHLDPSTTVQVAYTPYGDVLLGTKWGMEATDCEFGSLHGWNTTNGSNVSLNNTTSTVFRMHYWSNRTLFVDGVETAWSTSGAIPVAHDVGGCWSVQPAFR